MAYNPNSSLGYYIDNAAKTLRARLNRKFLEAGHDVTAEQWKILAQLWQEDGLMQHELATRTAKNKVSTTLLIDGLEKRGLVTREQDENDRRVKRIHLTDQGISLQRELTEIGKENVAVAQEGISDAEIEACISVLQRVLNNARDSAFDN